MLLIAGQQCALAKAMRCAHANPAHGEPPEGLWCSPTFALGPASLATRADVDGVPGAFRLHGVLSRSEAASMVAMAERMGLVETDGESQRQNGALSWALHDSLCLQLAERLSAALPAVVRTYAGSRDAGETEEMLRIETARLNLVASAGGGGAGAGVMVRRADGAPEGRYTLAGVNPRARIYRYTPDSGDAFLPHMDDVWPAARLHISDDGVPTLAYDGWSYSASAEGEWSWTDGDRVSQLSLLLYLSDGFVGGETVLHPPQGPSVAVAPVAGDALCFGQSFRLGRDGVAESELALIHEGRRVQAATEPATGAAAPPGAGFGRVAAGGSRRAKRLRGKKRGTGDAALAARAGAKYVLRSDILYQLPLQ